MCRSADRHRPVGAGTGDRDPVRPLHTQWMFNFTNSTQPLYLLGLEHDAAAVDGERGHLAVGIDLQILGRLVLARVHIDELQPKARPPPPAI